MSRSSVLSALLLALMLGVLLAGCGGGGGGKAPSTPSVHPVTPLRLTIGWPLRGRAVEAPSSALSCMIALYKDSASLEGTPDYQWTINRQTVPEAYDEHWTSPDLVATGPWYLILRFYAESDGQGEIVSQATEYFTLAADGSGADAITLTGSVHTVSVETPSSDFDLGETRPAVFAAKNAEGRVLALTPGSARWAISGDALALQDGLIEAKRSGTGTVSVTVDTVTGEATLTVKTVQIVVTPADPTMNLGATQNFTATVTGAINTAVTWRTEGGGTLTGDGNTAHFTAPASDSTCQVIATSVADPAVEKSVTVTVVKLTPDLIAYTITPTQDSVNCGVYVVPLDASAPPRLVSKNGCHPEFSPDGKTLLVCENYGAGYSGEIVAYNLENPSAPPRDYGRGRYAQYFMNGQKIAYSAPDGSSGYLVNIIGVDGRRERQLNHITNSDEFSITQDGAHIAYVEPENNCLRIYTTADMRSRVSVSSSKSPHGFEYSPDGQYLYIAVGDGRVGVLMSVSNDGMDSTPSTNFPGDINRISFSPDGHEAIVSGIKVYSEFTQIISLDGVSSGAVLPPGLATRDSEATWWGKRD